MLKFTHQKWQNDSKRVKLNYGWMTWSFRVFVTLKDDQIPNPRIYITSEKIRSSHSFIFREFKPIIWNCGHLYMHGDSHRCARRYFLIKRSKLRIKSFTSHLKARVIALILCTLSDWNSLCYCYSLQEETSLMMLEHGLIIGTTRQHQVVVLLLL